MTTLRFGSDVPPPISARMLGVSASITAILAMSLLTLSIASGSSHLAFQFIRPPADVAAMLTRHGDLLRLEMALDYVFLCAYCVMFLLLSRLIGNRDVRAFPLWLGLLLGSAAFDIVENAHVLAMLNTVVGQLALSQQEILLQAIVGHCKFMLNFVGLVMLSFALPRSTRPERVLVVFLRWIQAPLGVALLVVPAADVRPFALLRVLGFIIGLWLLAWISHTRGATDPD